MDKKEYDLLIVESPAKAKTIQKYLSGTNIKVVASVGHIKELPKKELGVDLTNFDIKLVTIKGKEDVIKEIKKLAKDARSIYIGSDPDREGESIASNLKDEIKRKDIYRVLFHEITKDAIEAAIKNAGKINEKKVESQKTRRILDRLVGYKISPLLWDKLGSGLSAGRVQSSALRLIVDREIEIENFIPEKYYQIKAKLKKTEMIFEANYFGETPIKKTELNDELQAKKIYEEILDKSFVVSAVEKKEKTQAPSPPFTTSKLQQEASNKLKFNPKQTMEIAQKLYDGSISLGERGGQGLITYIRSDSVRINPEFQEKTKEFILKQFGSAYVPSGFNTFKSKSATTQDAHEAIRPTNLENDPDSIKKYLSKDEHELYKLIWNKYLASQMTSAIFDTTVVIFNVNSHFFKSTGSVVKFDGFRKLYFDDENKKEEENGTLPNLIIGESHDPIEKPQLLEKFTLPPPRYNEASLIKTLEDLGIGRPSTYSSIISNITDRNYVGKSDGRFVPTETGRKLSEFLVKNFQRESDYKFTAIMETKLDEIEYGKLNHIDVLIEFWRDLKLTLDKKSSELKSIDREPFTKNFNLSGIKCISCDGEYAIKVAKSKEFLGCTNYPTCKSTRNFKKTKSGKLKLEEEPVEYHSKPCPSCGKRLVLREGKFGNFYSCEGYKDGCKRTVPVTTGVTCPDCKVNCPKLEPGQFSLRYSKKTNREFYSCSNYPECKTIIGFKPINSKCSHCGYSVLGIKSKTEAHCGKCRKITRL